MKNVSVIAVLAVCMLLDGLAWAQPAPAPTPDAPAVNPNPQPNPNAPANPPGRRGRGGVPATPEDLAEIATLEALPAYTKGAGNGDFSVGPDYVVAPEDTVPEGTPRGKIVRFTMNAADSKIYPGTFERAVAVYIPAQYVAGTAAPFIISCDQWGLTNRNGHFENILDVMIAQKKLPVMCAVMIANGGMQNQQRSVEYDTVSAKYSDFVEEEVLPRVEKEAGIKLTKDPEGRMTFGGSSGGICALTMAWFHPERYRRVISYSGTFVNLQRNEEYPHGGWEYHENMIPKNPAKPLRIWIHVSQNDNGATTAASNYRNWVIANIRMAKVLKEKGYNYQFVYSKNSGHTDSKVTMQTLPQALEFVWQGYPVEGKK